MAVLSWIRLLLAFWVLIIFWLRVWQRPIHKRLNSLSKNSRKFFLSLFLDFQFNFSFKSLFQFFIFNFSLQLAYNLELFKYQSQAQRIYNNKLQKIKYNLSPVRLISEKPLSMWEWNYYNQPLESTFNQNSNFLQCHKIVIVEPYQSNINDYEKNFYVVCIEICKDQKC